LFGLPTGKKEDSGDRHYEGKEEAGRASACGTTARLASSELLRTTDASMRQRKRCVDALATLVRR